MYDSILAHLKPPPGAAQLRYAEAFDYDFSNFLRERESPSLAEMKNDAVKVEVNMIATKNSNMGKTKLKEEDKPSIFDDKFDSMMKTMKN